MIDTQSINFLGKKIILEKHTDDDKFLSSLISELPIETRALEVGAHVGKFSKPILEKFHNALIIEGEETNYFNLLIRFPEYTDKIKKQVVYNDNKEHNWYFVPGTGMNALIMPLMDSKTKQFTKNKVKTVTLDSIGFDFDFIKTDCEGADFKIILGASKLISKNRPLIYFEHSGEIGARNHNYTKDTFFDFFEQKNYSLFFTNGDEFLAPMWYTDTMKTTNLYNILAIPQR
jgi:FkbM family methyltransferase